MRKYLGAIYALLMWASGTGFILITLSGETLQKALLLSGVTLVVMLAAIGLGIGMDD